MINQSSLYCIIINHDIIDVMIIIIVPHHVGDLSCNHLLVESLKFENK